MYTVHIKIKEHAAADWRDSYTDKGVIRDKGKAGKGIASREGEKRI